jgi:DNA-binding NarL/FixJ family response regulator
MRVFLVDDTKVMRTRLAAMILKIEEVELVGQAVSIAEATAGIAALRPDLVVVDVDLTDGNGLVVLEFAKRRIPPPAVVMLSAHSDAIYRERSLAAGADRFLDKTTELDQLSPVLRRFASELGSASSSQPRT